MSSPPLEASALPLMRRLRTAPSSTTATWAKAPSSQHSNRGSADIGSAVIARSPPLGRGNGNGWSSSTGRSRGPDDGVWTPA